MFDLKRTTHVVSGVANESSICWAITQQIVAAGGKVILTCHPEHIERGKVQKLAKALHITNLVPCDVASDESMDECIKHIAGCGRIDGFVHGIGFSDRNELRDGYLSTTRENFRNTLDISCNSLLGMARRLLPHMNEGGSMLTLSFEASAQAYQDYGLMGVAKAALEASVRALALELGPYGIRVNGISASPEKTLAGSGIKNRYRIGYFAEAVSPLRRRATLEEIGNAAVFLLSSYGSGINGENIHVDCGSHAVRLPPEQNRDLLEKAYPPQTD